MAPIVKERNATVTQVIVRRSRHAIKKTYSIEYKVKYPYPVYAKLWIHERR